MWLRSRTQHERVGADSGHPLGGDRRYPVSTVPVSDVDDPVSQPDTGQLLGRPGEVIAELVTQRIKILADIKRIDPSPILQIVQEGVGAGRMGLGDLIR